MLAALYVYITIFVRYSTMESTYDFEAHYYTYIYGPRVSLVAGAGYVWIIIVFFRKTIRASGYAGRISGRNPFSAFLIALVKMLRPRGAAARSYRALGLLTMGMFAIAFFYILMSSELISRVTYGMIYNSVGLLTGFALFLVYTNNTFEPSSFRWRLIGVTLAPVLLLLGIFSSVILSHADRSFDRERRLESRHMQTELSARRSFALPGNVEYVVSRPAGAESPVEEYVLEWSRRDDLRPALFIQSDLTALEKRASSAEMGLLNGGQFFGERTPVETPAEAYVKAVPQKDAEILRGFRYFDLEDSESFFIHYTLGHRGRLYEIGYSYTWYREKIHALALKLFFVIMGTTVILLVLFPVFFYWNLFRIDLRIY
jgi:hypothetical protein